jgi:hypothetical protein
MTKKALSFLLILIILLPVIIYFLAWDFYAINIPKWDDHPLKGFIDQYAHAADWNGKITALTRQHNEHRIALTRLFAWIDFSLFGHLNYRHLMFVGNMLLVAIIPLWYILLKNNKKPLFALVPVPFLLLSLAMWENMYWGMASIQNFGVVTLSLWALYLCINPKNMLFALSIPMAAVAVYTSPNALFILPIGAFLIFLTGNRQRFALFLIISAALIFSYFTGYKRADYNPESKASLLQIVKGYMAFLGSFAESFPVLDHFAVCVFIGSILFLVAISVASTTLFRIIRNKYAVKFEKTTDLFCLGAILFILATALVVVYGRAGFGLPGLTDSKYKIYSVLLLIVAYLYIVIPIRGSFLSPYITAIIFFAVIFNVFSYHYHLVDASKLRKMLTTSQFNSIYTDKTLTPVKDTSFVANIVAKTPVFYDSWPAMIKIADRQGYAGTTHGLTDLYEQTSFNASESGLIVKNENFSSQRLQDSGVYIILSSDNRFYVFPAERTRNKNRKQLFIKQYYFSPGYYSNISFVENQIEKGDYKIGLLRQQGNKIGILFKNKKIHVPEVKVERIKVNW